MADVMKIINLNVGFKESRPLLSELNLSGKKGECIGIMGRNGQGKTSLLRTISGLLQPLSGSVFINGGNLQQMSSTQRAAALSIVLTQRPEIANISVAELIGYGRYPFTGWLGIKTSKDLELINEAIVLCELTHLRDRKIIELSDGERQKVMIARCLAQNTNLILLDEPTIHLDVGSKTTVFKLLKNIAVEKDLCVIFITHELHLALQYCNKIWLLEDGKVKSDTPDAMTKDGSIQKAFGIDSLKDD